MFSFKADLNQAQALNDCSHFWSFHIVPSFSGSSADVSVFPGSSAVLNCSFTLPSLVDDSLLNITWSFSGLVIASRNHTQPGFFLNTTASFIGSFPLTVYNATPDQQGVYECTVSYNETNYSTDVTLTVLGESNC